MIVEVDRRTLDIIIEQCNADGCDGCAFADIEEWEEPCRRCARNCKDYWRASAKLTGDQSE